MRHRAADRGASDRAADEAGSGTRPVRRRRRFRRPWRRGLLTSVALTLAIAGPRVLPTANALSLPIRVPGAHARIKLAGPAPGQYPFRSGGSPLALDPFGFVVGQCTSFAAWWLNRHGLPMAVLTVGPRGTGSFLNASTWDGAARAAGFSVGPVPVVGAVAQWRAGERSMELAAGGNPVLVAAGGSGHVAVVIAVLPDGEAEWAEYGWHGAESLHIGHGWAPRYLYLGVTPPTVFRTR